MTKHIVQGAMVFLFAFLFCLGATAFAEDPPAKPDATPDPAAAPASTDPFSFGDFTWMNGTNRQTKSLLDTKYFTGSVLLDVNYTYDFNRPKDDTIVGSTTNPRHNEFNLMLVSGGGDFHYQNARATVNLQFGQMTTLAPRNDVSVGRGQYDLLSAFRYIREAHAGYHWDVMHGINLDAGVFMPYIGMSSYLAFENWSYQPSYTSNFLPSYLTGARLQMFPTDRLKVEVWVVNGWQAYGTINDAPGWGVSINHAPVEWISYTLNGYYGTDTPMLPGRVRLHMDDSLQIRYFNAPGAGFSKGAISIAADAGAENGEGVSFTGQKGKPQQDFLGFEIYNRLWFLHDLIGWTIGGGAINNPGRYLVILPPGAGATAFATNPGSKFRAWDGSTTLDFMPLEYLTYRLEADYRGANVNYFGGRGGVTSPSGWSAASPGSWKPDLVKDEFRVTAAMLFRM